MITIIKLFKRKPELHWPALMWFLSATIADVLITVTLVINLVSMSSGHHPSVGSKAAWVTVDPCANRILSLDVRRVLPQQMMPSLKSFEVSLAREVA